MKKIKCFALAFATLCASMTFTACGGNGGTLTKDDIPNYSAYSDRFEFFGYHSAHDGYYYIDDAKYYVGESFLTTEQYQMYKDSGMTMFYPQSILKVDKKNDRQKGWEKLKAEIDKLVAIGMDRTIIYDEDLSWLGLKPGGLVGEGKTYETEAELDDAVYELVSIYAGYPGVYGVQLADEPKDIWATSYGEVYNSLKRVSAKYGFNLYISYNLNPLNLNEMVYEEYYPHVDGTQGASNVTGKASFEDGFKRYKQYIEDFMESMHPDYVRYDDYPLRNGQVSSTYIPCMQYIAGVAKERGIDFRFVTQTFDMNSNGTHSLRKLDENGAKWLNNMILGFGVNEISYFTYFTNTENRSDGETFIDNCSFVNLYGQKTPIYDIMQNIMSQNQAFAPTILRFRYNSSGVFTHPPLNYPAEHIQYVSANTQTYSKLKSVSVNKECAMVNELYDKENDRYMYMAMNIVDPVHQGSSVYETITLQFNSGYKYALVVRDGKSGLYKLKDSKLEVKAAPGEASFVIPF